MAFLHITIPTSYMITSIICLALVVIITFITFAYKKIIKQKISLLSSINIIFTCIYMIFNFLWAINERRQIGDDALTYIVKSISLFSLIVCANIWVLLIFNKIGLIKNDALVVCSLIPSLIIAIFAFTAPSNGLLFTVDENNHFLSGKLYVVFLIANAVYYITAIGCLVYKLIKEKSNEILTHIMMIICLITILVSTLIQDNIAVNLVCIAFTFTNYVKSIIEIFSFAYKHRNVISSSEDENDQLNTIDNIYNALSNAKTEKEGMYEIIDIICKYYEVERTIVFMIDKENNEVNCTLELNKNRIIQPYRFLHLDLSLFEPINKVLSKNNTIIVDKKNYFDEIKGIIESSEIRNPFKSIMLMSIGKYENQKGLIAFVNPNKNINNLLVLKSFANLSTHDILTRYQNAEEERKVAIQEKNRAISFADLFSSTYISAYYVDIETGECVIYQWDNYLKEKYGDYKDFFETMEKYINNDVAPDDREFMRAMFNKNYIRNKLRDEFKYSAVIKDISKETVKYYNFEVVRGVDKDHCAVGFSDITSEITNRDELVRLQETEKSNTKIKAIYNVLESITSDFISIANVNFDTEEISFYKIVDSLKEQIPNEILKYPFEKRMEFYADNSIYYEDKEEFLKALTKENILNHILNGKIFTHRFRINSASNINWLELKFIKDVNVKDHNCAIMGLRNVTEETLAQNIIKEENEKQKNYSIIENIGSDYVCIDYVTVGADESKDVMESYRTAPFIERIIPEWSTERTILGKLLLTEKYALRPENVNTFRELANRDRILKELKEHNVYNVTIIVTYKDFDYHYQLKFSTINKDNEGNVSSFVIALRSIEEEVRREINTQNKLQSLLKQADSANVAKTRFLFNMSHDIRTPMNAIIGYTQMAKKHLNEPENIESCLNKINIASDQLLNLINEVLDMSRIEAGRIDLELVKANVIERAHEMISIISASSNEKNIKINAEVKNVIHANVLCDANRVNQIVLNVLSNAVKYSPDNSEVTYVVEEIASDKEGFGKYRFTIKDHGIGMSKEFLKNIYSEFSRERNTTSSKVPGTGLGMSIVKKLVDYMGGDIHIESERNVGTSVEITFSFKLDDNALVDNVNNPTTLYLSKIANKRVLLVEDNEMNREIASDILSDLGVNVETAEDGDVAVNKVKNSEVGYYDCILMDIQMPILNGYEATKLIRAIENPKLANIPIVAMTANAFAEDRENSINAGMDEHITKPIDVDNLIKVLYKFMK